MRVFTGFALGIIISVLAWQREALTKGGALAAAFAGGVIFTFGGLPWAALLLAFFIPSSLLSRAFHQRKVSMSEKFSKGSQRDWGQVLANSGVGVVLAILTVVFPGHTWMWVAYAGAIAAVSADTWATELGVLDPRAPRLITSGEIVEAGTSGGLSLWGTLASLGGALTIGLVGGVFPVWGGAATFFLAATLGGVCGSLFDSLLGATVQAMYHCPRCRKETERHPAHTCGTPTHPTRGWRWLNNDMVNFLASTAGATVATGVWLLLSSYRV